MNFKEKDDDIKSFWQWFTENESLIIDVYENANHTKRDQIIISFDNHILGFGKFSWKIGERDPNQYYFTISPNGDKDLLQLSKYIMDKAPDLDRWKFFYAHPVDDKNLELKLFDDYMQEQVVDASSWNFVLEKNPDNSVNIFIEASNIPISDYDTRQSAGQLVVTKLIGEEMMISRVNEIEVFNNFMDNQKGQGKPIRKLGTYFR